MPVLSTAIERGGWELKVAPAVARLVWIDQLRLEKATGVEFKEPLPSGWPVIGSLALDLGTGSPTLWLWLSTMGCTFA